MGNQSSSTRENKVKFPPPQLFPKIASTHASSPEAAVGHIKEKRQTKA